MIIAPEEHEMIDRVSKALDGKPMEQVFALCLSLTLSCADSMGLSTDYIFAQIRAARPEIQGTVQ